jgi:hypothetical protein
MIVGVLPRVGKPLGVFDRFDEFHVEQLVTENAVVAFDFAVLPW